MRSRRFPAALLLGSLLVSRASAQTPSDPATALELAIAMAESSLRKGDLQAAETSYREALFQGWLLMGTLERLERRLPEAREALRNASLFRIERGEALQSLALAQLQMGEAAEAVEILTDVGSRSPRDTEGLRLLAKALAATGQIERAVAKLEEATPTAAGDPERMFLLATEYLWLKRVEAAERLFAEIVKARPIPQTRVLIGRSYRDAGEYERARTELRAAMSQDPTVRRAHYYLGMVHLADATTGPDRLDKAIAEFREELKLAPEDPLANDQLGTALLAAGRQAEALPAFETAVRGEARSLYVYHLGRGQLALGRPAEAAATTRRALELARGEGASDSELERIHYQLGLALRKLGMTEEAATHLAEAKRMAAQGTAGSGEDAASGAAPEMAQAAAVSANEASPLAELPLSDRREVKRRVATGLARAYFNLGVLQAQSQSAAPAAERFARAAAFFERAAQIDPDFPQVQSSLGVAFFNARQFAKAAEPLGRALAASPEDAGLKRMLALSWLNTQAWEKAAVLLQDDPERGRDTSLQFAYGLALVRSHRGAEAEKVLAGLLGQQGDSAELSVLLGQAYALQGKHDPAVKSLIRALQLKPDVAEANATLGSVYSNQGRLREAEQALRAELSAYPSNVPSQLQLAVVLDAARRPDEALPLLRAVLESEPESAGAHSLLGKILLAQGAATEALEHLEAAARLMPADAAVRDQLGRAYQELGRTELARQQFEVSRRLKAKR